MRRVASPVWTTVLVAAWIFAIRSSLMGFYDGAWLLTGALMVRALERKDFARAVLWFVASALINYRASSLAPFGLYAFWCLVSGADPLRKKIAVTVVSALSALVVVTTFWCLVHYSPHDKEGVESVFFPMKFRGWFLLGLGVGLGALLFRETSRLTGVSIALGTVLCILHAGHSWHGFLCFPPLLALSIAPRRPVWAQIAVGLWMVLFWRFAFYFEPFNWLEEIFVFVQKDGLVSQ
jgi:hypothetical protein